MQLPPILQEAIELEVSQVGLNTLIHAREKLSESYRKNKQSTSSSRLIDTDNQRLSYLITRLPATYAAICKVMQTIQECAPEIQCKSLLDLGAGPGTAMWAVTRYFDDIEKITQIEQDFTLSQLGKRLSKHAKEKSIQDATWINRNFSLPDEITPHDLTLFSYSINEIDKEKITALIAFYWKMTNEALVIIEPGTPAGFERIREIRNLLIEMGAHLLAPCPHAGSCPMTQNEWCHFSVRLERSSLHRKLKGGSLGYEDEKFSYLVATKKVFPRASSRIIGAPMIRSGHVLLPVCENNQTKLITISKKSTEKYKKARKSNWGDAWSTD